MSFWQAAVLGAVAALLCFLLRPQQKELAAAAAAGAALCLAAGWIARIREPLSAFVSYCEESGAGETVGVLLRALGVAYISHIASGACRDVGENGLGGQIEYWARVEIAVLSLPMAYRILAVVRELLT